MTLGLALNEKKDFAAAIGKFDIALQIDPNAKDAIVGHCDALNDSNAPKDKRDAKHRKILWRSLAESNRSLHRERVAS